MAELTEPLVDQLSPETLDLLARLPNKRRLYVLGLAVPGSPTYGLSTDSALKAGYRNGKDAAERIESTELGRLTILCITRDLQEAVREYTLCDAAWIQRRLSLWANSTLLDFGTVDAEGNFTVDLRGVANNPELASRIESIEVKDGPWGRTQKLKLVSPATVVQLLGRHEAVGAWRETLEITTGDRAERIQRAALRQMEDARRLTDGAQATHTDVSFERVEDEQ